MYFRSNQGITQEAFIRLLSKICVNFLEIVAIAMFDSQSYMSRHSDEIKNALK